MGNILVYPNKILRKKTEVIETVDSGLIKEIEALKKELTEAENGAGLAAPQIGISKRFLGMKEENKKIKVIINPKIKATFGEKTFPVMIDEKGNKENFLEGCLSFPGFWGRVKRWLKIKVEWQEIIDKKLISKSEELEGFKAIVWQHETDHLDGVVFVDRVKKDKGKFYKSVEGKMKVWGVDKII